MHIHHSPRQLAQQLVGRSVCRVQMAAVIHDRTGIFAWGWNHMGLDGLGEHAEACAIRRANRKRLPGATITVAGQHARNSKWSISLPCMDCMSLIQSVGISRIVYHDKTAWRTLTL